MISARRGVALLWVLLLSVVLIIITGSMVNIITKESQATVRTENSVQAYYAAKAGVEWYLKEKITDPGFVEPENCVGGTPTTINIDTGIFASICKITTEKLRSTGNIGNSTRSIEYLNSSVVYTDLDLNAFDTSTSSIQLPTAIADDQSFELIIKFYPQPSAADYNNLRIGFMSNNPGDLAGNRGVGLRSSSVSPTTLHLASKNGGTFNTTGSGNVNFPFTDTDLNGQAVGLDRFSAKGLITAKIKFVRGEYASVTYEGNFTQNGVCFKTSTIPLNSVPSMGAFNYFITSVGSKVDGMIALGVKLKIFSVSYRAF